MNSTSQPTITTPSLADIQDIRYDFTYNFVDFAQLTLLLYDIGWYFLCNLMSVAPWGLTKMIFSLDL